MATIRNTISLTDKMTPVLRSITRALDSTLNAMQAIDGASGTAFDAARRDVQSAIADVNRLNQSIDDTAQATEQLQGGFSGFSKFFVTANAVMNVTRQVVSAVSDGLTAISDMTDQQARLARMAGDTMSIYELQEMIATAADDTRSSYTETASSVLTMYNALKNAGVTQQQSVRLAEILNKQFGAAGVKGAAMSSAAYQLSQSLATGRLRYEDWKLVMANAPALVENIATAAGVSTAAFNQMVSDGKVSSQRFAELLWATGEDIDKVYESMPDTFADQMERVKTAFQSALMGEGGLQSVISEALNSDAWNSGLESIQATIRGFLSYVTAMVAKIQEKINDPSFQQGISYIAGSLHMLAGVIGYVFDLATTAILWVIEWAPVIGPIIWTIVAAITAAMVVTRAVVWWTTALAAIQKILTVLSVAWGILTGNTAAASAATFIFNGVLTVTQILILSIIGIVLVVIGLIFVIVGLINKLTGSTISALGVIAGAITTAVAFIWNIVVGVINAIIQFMWTYFVEPWIGIIEWVLNVFNGGFNNFGDAVKNLLGNIISWFLSLGKVVTKIIDAIFGTDWTTGLNNLQGEVLKWGKNNEAITLSREAPDLSAVGVGRWEYGDAWNTGYNWGEKTDKKLTGMLKGIEVGNEFGADAASSAAKMADLALGDGINTKGEVDITEEDIKLLKDVAAAEWVNRYTTLRPEMHVTFGDVRETADVEQILSTMETMVEEAYASALVGS